MKLTAILPVFLIFSLAVSVCAAVADSGTTEVQISGNLDAGSDIIAAPPSYPLFSSIYNVATFVAPVWVSSSSGYPYQILFAYFHTAVNGWTVIAFLASPGVSIGFFDPIILGSLNFTTHKDGEVTPSEFVIKPNGPNATSKGILVKQNLSSFDNLSLVERIKLTPNSCPVGEFVVTESIEATKQKYESFSCSNPYESYVITSKQLAERAIKSKNCDTKKFRTKKECRECFNLVALPLKQKFDEKLFNGLLAKARIRVFEQKGIICSALTK